MATAIAAMREHLETADVHLSEGWPTNFCGSSASPRYSRISSDETIEIFAKELVATWNRGDDDYAIEKIAIDMKNRTFTDEAVFYVGYGSGSGIRKTSRSGLFYRKLFEKEYGAYTIKEKVPVNEILPACTTACESADFLFILDDIPKLAVFIKTEQNKKKKTFKAVSAVFEDSPIPCVVLDNVKDAQKGKILAAINNELLSDRFAAYILTDSSVKEKTKCRNVAKQAV